MTFFPPLTSQFPNLFASYKMAHVAEIEPCAGGVWSLDTETIPELGSLATEVLLIACRGGTKAAAVSCMDL